MYSKFPGRSYIQKIADILMEEGDIETAKALKQQAEIPHSREMTEEEAELYEINKMNFRKAIRYGDFERAVDFQIVALGIAQEAFGAEHMETLKHMCELGECYFRNGAYQIAQDFYYRTLGISSTKFGALHPFSNRIKKNIRKCADAIQRATGLRNLERHINNTFGSANSVVDMKILVRIERLENIGNKLQIRGQFGRAIKIYKTWINLTLEVSAHADEDSIEYISKYANYLAACGELNDAEITYRSIVQLRNRQNQSGERSAELKIAITDWAKCLSLMGHHKSARETDDLSKKILNYQ